MATAQLTDNHLASLVAAQIARDFGNINITSFDQASKMLKELGLNIIISDQEPAFVTSIKKTTGVKYPVECMVVTTQDNHLRAYIPAPMWQKQTHEMNKVFLSMRALGHVLFDCVQPQTYYLDSPHYWFQHWVAERRASLFAGYVLMPHAVFDKHLYSCKMSEDAIDLKELADKMGWPEELAFWWGRQLHYFRR